MGRRVELVGRERELGALIDRLDRAAAGEGGLLLVAGEAGVGKTCLVEAVLADCAALVLRGLVSDRGRTPYAPIVAVLREYDRLAPGVLAGSGRLAGHLAVLVPELGPAPRTPDRLGLAEALCEAFVRISARQPAVVFLDDVQWGDEATLDLLPLLAAAAGDRPLLFLAAYRSD